MLTGMLIGILLVLVGFCLLGMGHLHNRIKALDRRVNGLTKCEGPARYS